MSKITFDEAWDNIFEHYNILEKIERDGFFDISAEELKRIDHKEPRLLTKIDHRQNLPRIMQEHNLAILAIQNGLYRIGHFDPFIEIQETYPPPKPIAAPLHLHSIDPFTITNENVALDVCALSGVFEDLFGEKVALTIRGRIRGDLFFRLNGIDFNVKGVQMEVDGGYEGKNGLYLIEAKIGYRNTLNIRQLLYPHLFWQRRVKKEVKSYIFLYQNGVFRFIPYVYDGYQSYADHTNERTYIFKPQKRIYFSLYSITTKYNFVDTAAPFPQADSFERLYDLFLEIAKGATTKEELFLNFDLTLRQLYYYLDAIRWMRLCSIDGQNVEPTDKALQIVQRSYIEQLKEFAQIIFSEPICYNILHEKPIDANLWDRYGIRSQSTKMRRIQTIKSWIRFFTNRLHTLFEGTL